MTKEEMLTLLTAAYTGSGSVEEGSFAGDVLRACADGMAQLWSMDIDGLEYRAFVSKATGKWLTAVCADRGIARREGEDDETLRSRALAALATTPASGNADHYKEWCLQVEDLLRVKVLPLARGNGTVDIVTVDTEGNCPPDAVLAETQAVVDALRPVGADARVVGAEETALDITATVALMDGANLEAVQETFGRTLAAFCKEMALLTNAVSYAKVLRLLLDTAGVADVADFTLCGSDESLVLADTAIPVCGTVTLGAFA